MESGLPGGGLGEEAFRHQQLAEPASKAQAVLVVGFLPRQSLSRGQMKSAYQARVLGARAKPAFLLAAPDDRAKSALQERLVQDDQGAHALGPMNLVP